MKHIQKNFPHVLLGNQVTDLLIHIPYSLESTNFQPWHIQYLSVHADVIDIIEMEVAEHDGTLVNFVGGV